MAKAKKMLSAVLAALMVVLSVASYVPAQAAKAVNVPKLQMVTQPEKEYKNGDRVSFTVTSPNYGGQVEYRVILWNGTTKKQSELWPTHKGYYYQNWKPAGSYKFTIHWPVEGMEPGAYSLTVLTRRANSKVAYDSFVKTEAFWVKNDLTVESIAPVADITVNEGEKVTLPENVTLNMSDKTTKEAKVTWAAVDTTKVGETTVEGTVEGTDKKATVKVVVKEVALDVTVSANNLKEITVKFNKKVDAKAATNVNNYKLNDAVIPTSANARILEDGMTVIINLRSYLGRLENQKNYKLGVNVDKLSKVCEFTPLDVTVPAVKSVEALGTKKVQITFSEPVDPNTALTRVNYQINGYVLNGEISQNKNNDVVTVSLYSPLKAGENKITVTGVKDFAGMTIVNYLAQPFTVVEDNAAPASFTVDEATLEYVTVTFNEPIDPASVDVANVYWSDNAGVTKHWATDMYPATADYKSYEIDFTGDRLPAKSTTLYIEKVADMSENEVAKLTSVITATVDIERPDVVSVDFAKDPTTGLYIVGNNKLEVKFNKTIGLDQFIGANATNLIVKNSLGKVAAVANTAEYKVVNGVTLTNTIIVTLDAALSDGRGYTVEVANVVDTTILANKMIPETFTLVGLAQTLPQVTGVHLYREDSSYYKSTRIQVVYSNEMSVSGDRSILDRSKYMLEIGSKWYPVPSSAIFQPTYNNMAVVITIPEEATYDGTHKIFDKISELTKVKVIYVADKNGNVLSGYTDEKNVTANVAANIKAPSDSDYYPVATAKDIITLTFDRPLQYVYRNDFKVVDATNKEYAISRATYKTEDGMGIVTLTMSDKIPANVETAGIKVVVIPDAKTIDLLGNKIAANAGIEIVDEVAPSLIATAPVKITSSTTMTISFDEALQNKIGADTKALAGSFTVTYGYNNTKLIAGIDYIAELDTNKTDVKITIIKDKFDLTKTPNIKVQSNDNMMFLYDIVNIKTSNPNKVEFGAKAATK